MSRSIGPTLPPGFLPQHSSDEDEEEQAPGPVLPASSKTADSAPPSIGPQFPLRATGTTQEGVATRCYGPALPPGLGGNNSGQEEDPPSVLPGPLPHQRSPSHSGSESDESDGEVIGPMPSTAGGTQVHVDETGKFSL